MRARWWVTVRWIPGKMLLVTITQRIRRGFPVSLASLFTALFHQFSKPFPTLALFFSFPSPGHEPCTHPSQVLNYPKHWRAKYMNEKTEATFSSWAKVLVLVRKEALVSAPTACVIDVRNDKHTISWIHLQLLNSWIHLRRKQSFSSPLFTFFSPLSSLCFLTCIPLSPLAVQCGPLFVSFMGEELWERSTDCNFMPDANRSVKELQ